MAVTVGRGQAAQQAMNMSDKPVIELRRYPSRKLYNTATSKYIRLPEIAEEVRKGAVIRVEDTESGEDVTRQVLLQIIIEQETQADGAVLSVDVLMDMIRVHQSKASEMMTSLFEQSVAFMRTQQEQLASQMSSSLTQPWGMFDPGQMSEMQREYQKQMAAFWGGPLAGSVGMPQARPGDARADEGSPTEAEELKALRERMDQLERKLSRK